MRDETRQRMILRSMFLYTSRRRQTIALESTLPVEMVDACLRVMRDRGLVEVAAGWWTLTTKGWKEANA